MIELEADRLRNPNQPGARKIAEGMQASLNNLAMSSPSFISGIVTRPDPVE
jgi:hypothetical protein